MSPCEAAEDVAEAMLEYRRAREDWKRQEDVWLSMLVKLDVYVAAKKAHAVQRLEGL